METLADGQQIKTQLAQPFINCTQIKKGGIRSCKLESKDLKDLYKKLSEKANEAVNLEIQSLSKERIEHLVETINAILNEKKLYIEIWGENNEYVTSDHISVFNDSRLPNNILKIKFTSYTVFNAAIGIRINNCFELQLDFTKNSITDFSKISNSITQNQSHFTIQGTNDTWVNGVYQSISDFFAQRASKRNWLYSKYIYDILLWFFSFQSHLGLLI